MSLSADVAVVMESWSSWILVRLRGDGIISQLYKFEQAQRFRLKDGYFEADREIEVGFSCRIESGGDAGAMRVPMSPWPTDAGVGNGASQHSQLRVLFIHERTKSQSSGIRCDTGMRNVKVRAELEVDATLRSRCLNRQSCCWPSNLRTPKLRQHISVVFYPSIFHRCHHQQLTRS